jgi:mRNA-degrading endonuclease RelE of RelBE toxin-antitoxin system
VTYQIQFTDDGLRDAKALPKNVRNTLARELKHKLAKDPEGCSEPLREPLTGWRSFHSGKYRVIFRLYKNLNIIAVAGIGKHSTQATQDIYRKLEALANSGRLAADILAALRSFSSSDE